MKQRVAVNERGNRIGAGHPRAVLTDAEVDLVFGLIEDGMCYREIAEKFEVSKSCIGHLASGRRRCQTPADWVEREIHN